MDRRQFRRYLLELNMQKAISTYEAALMCNVKPQTLRRRVCKTGSYFGVTPVKFKNGRLGWSAESLASICGGKGA